MEQHRTLTIEGRTVHYRDEGRNNTDVLVLLHGYLQNLDVWSSYVISYMHQLRVVTIDLPGHGHSDTYCDMHSMDFMAGIVKAVLTEAGISRCVLVGHSMGGYVALAFASRYPSLLRGLGLINSHAFSDTDEHRTYREEVCRMVQENRAAHIVGTIPSLFDERQRASLSHDIRDLQEQCLLTTSESIVAAQRGMAARQAHIHTLENIECPVFFVYGKNDSRIPLELAVSGAMLPRRSEIHLLDNVGHMAFMEAPRYVKPRLLSFVKNCYLL